MANFREKAIRSVNYRVFCVKIYLFVISSFPFGRILVLIIPSPGHWSLFPPLNLCCTPLQVYLIRDCCIEKQYYNVDIYIGRIGKYHLRAKA